MTIVINFHQEGYRDFKHYCQNHVKQDLAGEFPNLVSYTRFVELMSTVLLPLCAYFAVNLLAGLIAYTHQPKKPSINWGLELDPKLPALICEIAPKK